MSYGLPQKNKSTKSGLIQGAGTGTSDDIQKNVPSGSFIMPADSTKQIGTDNLKNMGSPTPVNLSNGEFQMSPEQVHSVGVQTLDAMKEQTHVPVDQPQLGFKPGQNKPEMYFANGGSVPDDDTFLGFKKSAFFGNALTGSAPKAATTQNNGASQQKSQAEKYTPPSFTESVVEDIGNNVGNEWKQGNYARSLGQGARGILTLPGAAAYDAFKPVGNFIGGFFNTDTSAPSSPATPAKQPEPAQKAVEKAATNTAPSPTSTPNTQNSTTQPPTNNTQPQDMFAVNQSGTQQQAQANPYAIQQKGNSFSYADPNAAAQARANGVPELQGSGVQRGVDVQGIKDFMAKTPEMSLGMQGYAGRPRLSDIRTPEQEAQLQTEISKVSTPIAGSKGLTASQRNQINDLQMGYSNRATDVYKTDANNATAVQREAMGQAGQNYRTELGEQGANNRFNSNLNLEAQKFNASNDLENRKFSEEQLNNMPARMKQAYELNILKQYEAAKTPEEKQLLAEKLGLLRGQQSQQGGNPYMQIKQGEVVNDKGEVTQPSKEYLFNTKTGQSIDPLANINSQNMQPTQDMIDDLRKDPNLAKNFEVFFGQGSAAKYLKG